ncbi:hypothetical protein Aple_099760 [Acrocarpospora pleiomorpha]|uniref:Uncharacterized protein n=1 Tax=Acrocarpospora pleiomorpha TaxID=90975 RepID=A0A5M3Y171_9ACTN|nr:hypothetical protein Aple_099760 [Acrocarpospora pleiomorpha]
MAASQNAAFRLGVSKTRKDSSTSAAAPLEAGTPDGSCVPIPQPAATSMVVTVNAIDLRTKVDLCTAQPSLLQFGSPEPG